MMKIVAARMMMMHLWHVWCECEREVAWRVERPRSVVAICGSRIPCFLFSPQPNTVLYSNVFVRKKLRES